MFIGLYKNKEIVIYLCGYKVISIKNFFEKY